MLDPHDPCTLTNVSIFPLHCLSIGRLNIKLEYIYLHGWQFASNSQHCLRVALLMMLYCFADTQSTLPPRQLDRRLTGTSSLRNSMKGTYTYAYTVLTI